MPFNPCLYSNEDFQSDGGLFIGLRLPQREKEPFQSRFWYYPSRTPEEIHSAPKPVGTGGEFYLATDLGADIPLWSDPVAGIKHWF